MILRRLWPVMRVTPFCCNDIRVLVHPAVATRRTGWVTAWGTRLGSDCDGDAIIIAPRHDRVAPRTLTVRCRSSVEEQQVQDATLAAVPEATMAVAALFPTAIVLPQGSVRVVQAPSGSVATRGRSMIKDAGGVKTRRQPCRRWPSCIPETIIMNSCHPRMAAAAAPPKKICLVLPMSLTVHDTWRQNGSVARHGLSSHGRGDFFKKRTHTLR
jgi:hypothetical protein